MAHDRVELAAAFDRAADLYQQARPDYPDDLFDRLVAITGLRPGDRVLEVGAGPGKATLPLARRGLLVTALEPGPALAAEARRNLGDYPVDVVEARFEEYIRLLNTFSGHIAMLPDQRERLFGEIRTRLAKRHDGRVRRGWGAVLTVARREPDAEPHHLP